MRSTFLSGTLAIAWLVAGCATPVGVSRSDPRDTYRTNNESVLSTSEPSVSSRQVLLRLGLFERFEEEPEQVLSELHARMLAEMLPARLFALAEYAEVHAEHAGGRPWHLAAALYAYAYLFPEDGTRLADPLDPRFRMAAAIYNRALANALMEDGRLVPPERLALPGPVGRLEVAFDEAQLVWAGRHLDEFVPAATLALRGLRNRYVRPGIGATYAVSTVSREGDLPTPGDRLVAARMRLPVAVLLRFEAPHVALREGVVRAGLEIYNARDHDAVEIAERRVPLEFETSAALALTLDGAPIWDTEIAGFRNPDLANQGTGLRTWGRHQFGRIPVVLVHGTASSAARWAELVNELESDPSLRRRYEFWFFTYATGQPIVYSAALLRDALRQAVEAFDPEGIDPGLRRIVLVGHSQGGLLLKLQVVSSGDRFWRALTDLPFDQVHLPPETRQLVEKLAFIEPLPFVERVVFISTPHRGSFLAGNWMGRLASSLTTSPQNLLGLGVDLARAGVALPGAAVDLALDGVDTLQGDEEGKLLRELSRLPSSVDNMDPGHRFIRTLSSLPVHPGVTAHSIVPVRGPPPAEGQNDGVVEYASAHIEEAASELVVYRSGHSVQGHPEAIQEVRRILLQHLVAVDEPVPPQPPQAPSP